MYNTLWCYSTLIYARLVCLILSPSLNIYLGLTEGTNMWLFLLLSHGCTVHYRIFQALSRALLSVVILDMHINFRLIVKPRMPPRRGQSYTEGVNKRRHAMDSSTASDLLVQPHPFCFSCRNPQMLPRQQHNLPFWQK